MVNIVRLASSGACGRRGESELASIQHVVGMGACARRGVQVSGGVSSGGCSWSWRVMAAGIVGQVRRERMPSAAAMRGLLRLMGWYLVNLVAWRVTR